jgi:hypothetical protein
MLNFITVNNIRMKNILLVIMLIVCMASCKKQDSEVKSDSVVIGDYSNMTTISYYTLLNFNNNFQPMNLDVDGDSIADFRIENLMKNHPNYSYMSAQITCLDTNTYLSKVDDTDTTYVYSEVEGDAIHGMKFYYFSCEKNSADSYVYDVEQSEKLKVYYKKGKVANQDSWKSGSFEIFNTGGFTLNNSEVFRNGEVDTNRQIYFTFSMDCLFMPQNRMNFIGFKKTKDKQTKFGWIEFGIIGSYSKSLYIIETAIQK